ncbi:MAG: hypothetical protein MZV64_31245 [Ignavibacteriales bacterium]|nr:hypothetical protein [Ignavibacteriales bacterium]
MAGRKPLEERGTGSDVEDRREVFLSHFTGKKRQEAEEQLDLGRASYRASGQRQHVSRAGKSPTREGDWTSWGAGRNRVFSRRDLWYGPGMWHPLSGK